MFRVLCHMQVFGAKLQLPVTHSAALAGLLLQPCTEQPFQQKGSQACPLTQLHLQLLQLVRVFSKPFVILNTRTCVQICDRPACATAASNTIARPCGM